MNVLSLCDGISCGQVAMQRAGLKVDNYFASEIESNPIAITQKNFPNTIQLGDLNLLATEEELKKLPKIDIILSGTPCTNLSITVANNPKHNQGLNGEKSSLFYKFYFILDWIKKYNNPNVFFLLENVESMNDKDRDIISNLLGVKERMFNSSFVSAQDRKRYYWTNIYFNGIPYNIHAFDSMFDIMEDEVDEKYYYLKETFEFHGADKRVIATLNINGHDILKRVYNPFSKSPTLTAVCGGNQHKKVFDMGVPRKLTPLEYERLQTLPDGYTSGFSDSARYKAIGNGWTVDIISWILAHLNKK